MPVTACIRAQHYSQDRGFSIFFIAAANHTPLLLLLLLLLLLDLMYEPEGILWSRCVALKQCDSKSLVVVVLL
jgi:hypothetical protein